MKSLKFHQLSSFFESIELNEMDYADLERIGLKNICNGGHCHII